MPEPFATGRLLVAVPTLPDPNFERAVVLVLDHDDDGAVGVILNRPSDTEVPDRLPEWRALAAEPPVVFVGGPVGLDAAIGLARVAPATPAEPPVATASFSPLIGSVGTVDLGRDPAVVGPPIETVRVFAGYAGWGSGQLEAEIEAGDWIIVDPVPDDVFTDEPDELWRDVLRRQGGRLSSLARFPPDLSMN